ncbi:response regulator transcription factor [Pedobacter sp. P351]|uniref:response regulator transcription factor n=1 Tax=Pedobacter superstes TaxID=3133441 RepID=UPI003097384A
MSSVKKKILIVDDEPDIRELLEYYLNKEGYLVSKATNGQEGIAEALKSKPDLIIMDIMMPKMDGIEACEVLRGMSEFNNTFLVFLTARSEEYSEIAGFNVGADDYISKPVKPKALVTRINAILKRNTQAIEPSVLKLQILDLMIDRETYLVYRGDDKITFAKKEFELLYLLASRPGKVFTREVILSSIWDNTVVVTNRTIDVHIRKVREKLGEKYISTIKGVGYKFEV